MIARSLGSSPRSGLLNNPPRFLTLAALAILGSLAMGSVSLGQKPEPKRLSFARDNRAQKADPDAAPVELNLDQDVHLVMPTSPGTGSTWKIKQGADFLKLESKPGGDEPKKTASNEKPTRVGQSEERIFRFHPLKKGKGRLKMVLTLPGGEEGTVFLVPFEIK